MSITKQATSGVKWTSISTVCKAVLQLAQLSVVAHYMTAEALGIYALVQVCLAFCQIFMDMGIGNAIIHQQNTSHKHLSELFIINLAIAALLSVSVYLAAPLLALFFEQSALTKYIQLVSIVFVVFAFSRIHLAQLQKQLAFSSIAKVELSSAVVGFSLVVGLTLNDYGVEALIYGYISAALFQTVLFWLVSEFRPSVCMPKSWSELKKYLSFGAYQTGDSTVNYFNSQFDLILVGKLLGAEVLGGYALARQFCFRPAMVINPVLTRVAFPVMAKLQSSDKLTSVYCKLSNMLAMLNFPLYVALAVLAEPIVHIVFGEKWLHIVPMFQLMAIWCLVRSVMNPVGSLLMAVGKVKLAFKWNSFLLLLIPGSIYIGSTFGIYGVACALVLLQICLLPGHWYFLLNKSIGISAKDFFKSLALPLIAAIISGFLAWMVAIELTDFVFFIKLTIGLIIGGISYVLCAYKLNPLFRNLLKGNFSLE